MYTQTIDTVYASYTVSFETMHSNADQASLARGANGGAFSGLYAIANSYHDAVGYDNLYGNLVGQGILNLNNGELNNSEIDSFEQQSKSMSQSYSDSIWQSESTSTFQSVSTSQSKSVSDSQFWSEMESILDSQSESHSKAVSESESLEDSASESAKASASLSDS
ncbi:hypothetical protein [Limosilactobacillus ingluviei]